MGITPVEFAKMQARIAKPSRAPAPAFVAPRITPARAHEVILGIDPSLRGTGFGILRNEKPHPRILAQGTVRSPAGWPRSRCLVSIAQALRDAINQHHPTICAIEGLFFAQNLQTALIMGEARGVCLLAAAEAGLDICEIAPRKVKQAIVGYGAAQKLAVAKMVQRMLRLPEIPDADAADALALALAFLHEGRGFASSVLKKL